MKNVVKICSVAGCGLIVLLCIIYYSGYVSQAYYDIRSSVCPLIEAHFEWEEKAVPEGYIVPDYIENMDDMKVVRVSWNFANTVNDTLYPDNFWMEYYGSDGRQLYVMEKDTENMIISSYENRKILPPGQMASVEDFVLVPEGVHEMECFLSGIWDETSRSARLEGKASSFKIPGKKVEDRFVIEFE